MDEVSRNRLEEFRQLSKEIRHPEECLIIGIDIAKERHYVFLGTAPGRTLLKRIVLSSDHGGFRKLLDHAETLRVQHGFKKVVYGMEPTPNYHKPLGEYLINLGRAVQAVSGIPIHFDGSWLWSRVGQGIGSSGGSGSISEWETGIETGWIRSECRSKWEGFGQSDSRDLQGTRPIFGMPCIKRTWLPLYRIGR